MRARARLARTLLAAALFAALSGACVSEKRQAQSVSHLDLGAIYLEERQPEQAIGELRQAVKLDHRNAAAWEKLGLAYMARGAPEEGRGALKRAVRLRPDDAQTLNNYGLVLLQLGDLDGAIGAFEHALEDLTYRKPAIVLNNLGYAYLQAGRQDDAIRSLDAALERSPNLCQARFHRGLAWQQKGDLDRALADLDKVVQSCGEQAPGAYYHAAEVLLAQGNRTAAQVYLQNALRMSDNDPKLNAAARELLAKSGG